ncbi:MAG TPA: chromate transporter [Firmicutes bacterium]|nr:chromate transporter [Bacillota bacterium]
MILLELFGAFFKIGLFTIGGGYAMLPLIQQEMETYGWLTAQQFIDIIAIAEITPGAIAVNTATFVGFRTAGIIGALVATGAIALPSLITIVTLSHFWETHQDHPVVKAVFAGIRPAVGGLIVAAAVTIAKAALLDDPLIDETFALWGIDLRSLLLAVAVFVAVRRYKADPIKSIMMAGAVGLLLFSF